MTTPAVTREGNRLVLETDFEAKDTVKKLPGRLWDRRRKRWHVPATQETVLEVREKLGDLRCDLPSLELLAAAYGAEEARALRFADDLPPIPGVAPSDMNPEGGGWPHQRQSYWFGVAQEVFAPIMGMGTGKSLVAIKLMEAWGIELAVIQCPSKVRKVWPREFAKWGDRDWIVDNGRFRKKDGSWKKDTSVSLAERVARMKSNIEKGKREGRPVAIVVNYEAGWQGVMREFLLSLAIDVLIFDEVHKIKKPGGKWSRFGAELRKRTRRVVGMTGTLFPHSEPDVYAQYRALDSGIFGTSYKKFKMKYFEMGGFEDKEIVGFLNDQAEEEFSQAWQRIAYVCDEDVLDLPGALDMPPVTCALGSKAGKAYKEISDDFITFACGGDEPVTAANALARLLRLQQITSGHLPMGEDEQREMVAVGEEKKKLLKDELEDIPEDEPVVVYARFTEDLKRIQEVAEELGRTYMEISGNRDDGLVEDPEDPSNDATMHPDCQILGAQLQAAAEGIDLTRAAYGIFYSLSLDLGNYLQIRKRQDRPGQTRLVRFGFLVAEGTVDEVIIEALDKRENVVSACVRAGKERGRLEAVAA